jgi:hypothetical protein
MRKLLTAGLMAGALLGTSLAGPAGAADEEKTYQGVRYVCTGVGQERDDPRWSAFPAKVMLTTQSGAYVADGQITIEDAAGKRVLETTCDAPWLLAQLAPGRYQVTAKVDRYIQKGTLIVPAKGQAAVTLRFWEIAG